MTDERELRELNQIVVEQAKKIAQLEREKAYAYSLASTAMTECCLIEKMFQNLTKHLEGRPCFQVELMDVISFRNFTRNIPTLLSR